MAVDKTRATIWMIIGAAIVAFATGCGGSRDETTTATSIPATSTPLNNNVDEPLKIDGSARSANVDSIEVTIEVIGRTVETSAKNAASTSSSMPQGSPVTTSPTVSSGIVPSTTIPSDTTASDATSSNTTAQDAATDRLLPAGDVDYQIGGSYPLPNGVTIVSRDRSANPAAGAYNICYINGFQTQPSETSSWKNDLLLKDASGNVIIDPDWNEALLDITTPAKRNEIAVIIGGWIDECARKGFDGVEIDNLDTYSRSGGRISQDNAVAMMATYSSLAHGAGMDIAQKNSAELTSRVTELGTDFAVVEGCSRYNECSVFTSVYGSDVVMIEYRDSDFGRGCAGYGDTNPIVLRDRNVSKPGSHAYTFRLC